MSVKKQQSSHQTDQSTPKDNGSVSPHNNDSQQHGASPDVLHDEKSPEVLAAEYLAGWQRAQADYKNLQRQMSEQQQSTIKFANKDLIQSLLPIIDHYAMACEHVPADHKNESWLQGFLFVQKQFTDLLDSMGVQRIATIGQPFDPRLHEAVSHEPHDAYESEVIFAEAQPGYQWHGTVLRPAKVKVAQ